MGYCICCGNKQIEITKEEEEEKGTSNEKLKIEVKYQCTVGKK